MNWVNIDYHFWDNIVRYIVLLSSEYLLRTTIVIDKKVELDLGSVLVTLLAEFRLVW
jgi:hypothetical protein